VSRGPELSHEQTSTTSLNGSSTPSVVDMDEHAGSSTIRRKASLVPALPITTQTTRLLSQQSRSGKDDSDGSGGSQRAESLHHGVPPPQTGAATTAADARIPTPTDNGAPRNAARVPAVPGHSPPHDLPSPPTSANTTVVDLSNYPVDNGVNRCANRAPPAPGQRLPATSTPTRSASARAAEGSGGHGSPARPKPAPPKRSETTKLSTADPRQTKAFIMNLDRVIKLKNCKGSSGLATLPVPLPPRPVYVEGPTYLDTDDLPPPPAELLEGLRSMRRQDMPLPPIPAPGRR